MRRRRFSRASPRAAPVGLLLGLVVDDMRQGRLGDLAREVRLFPASVAETRPEAVDGDVPIRALEHYQPL